VEKAVEKAVKEEKQFYEAKITMLTRKFNEELKADVMLAEEKGNKMVSAEREKMRIMEEHFTLDKEQLLLNKGNATEEHTNEMEEMLKQLERKLRRNEIDVVVASLHAKTGKFQNGEITATINHLEEMQKQVDAVKDVTEIPLPPMTENSTEPDLLKYANMTMMK